MIGERLKEIRKRNKVKQSELAELLGVRNTAISRYETTQDTPSDKNKLLIAQHFDVSLDYFFGIIDEPLPLSAYKNMLILPTGLSESQITILNNFAKFLERQNH